MSEFTNTNIITICDLPFKFIQELEPKRDAEGHIIQSVFDFTCKPRELHYYGNGPFCNFEISKEWNRRQGVYVLYDNEKHLYVGECEDFHHRFSKAQYGSIYLSECFKGRHSTNCKINSMVLWQYLNGNKVFLYFHETDSRKNAEKLLERKLNPPFNGTPSPKLLEQIWGVII
jgi:hypothetical protein